MTLPLLAALAVFAYLVGRVAATRLGEASWITRAPATAMRVWMALAVSNLVTVVMMLVLVSHDVFEQLLIRAFRADKTELHLAYAGADAVDPAWNGAAILAGLVLIGTCCLTAFEWLRRARSRRWLRSTLLSTSRVSVNQHEVVVLPSPDLEAFCVPQYGGGRVFVSHALIEQLTGPQLAAAVEHEVAHLARKHHVWLLIADVLGRVLSPLRLCVSLPQAMRVLVELDADDRASRRAGIRPLAQALLQVANSRSASGTQFGGRLALGLGDEQPGQRIQRLVEELSSDSRGSTWVGRCLDVVVPLLVAAPVVSAVLPGIALWGSAS